MGTLASNRYGWLAAVLLAAAVVAAACAGVQSPTSTQPLTLTLGTSTPGGGFPVYGAAFKAVIEESDPAIRIETRNTSGSAENVPMLEEGKLDLALVQGEAAYEALAGLHRPSPSNIKVLWAMYSSPGMFVVRADSPYHAIADLKGKPVAWGAKGSGLVLLAGYTLDALGLDRDRDFKSSYLDRAGDGPAMVLEGRAAALWGGGLGYPAFATLADSPGGARFIVPSSGEIERITAKHRFLKRITIPAGSYKGITRDLVSVGSWSFVFARADLPEDIAYRVARALHRNESAFARQPPYARDSTALNTLEAPADRATIHPGVMRYLREAGIAR
ncbi:MAG TPA: TAXI family TRAP transporter solute-binding subunit [Usitatibacter sp.]|nr:TAXI family TRAP transporter solute-binding subunit [Usitatibacter sp.]